MTAGSVPQRIKGRCRECGCHLTPGYQDNVGYCVNPRCLLNRAPQTWSRPPPEGDVIEQARKGGLLP